MGRLPAEWDSEWWDVFRGRQCVAISFNASTSNLAATPTQEFALRVLHAHFLDDLANFGQFRSTLRTSASFGDLTLQNALRAVLLDTGATQVIFCVDEIAKVPRHALEPIYRALADALDDIRSHPAQPQKVVAFVSTLDTLFSTYFSSSGRPMYPVPLPALSIASSFRYVGPVRFPAVRSLL